MINAKYTALAPPTPMHRSIAITLVIGHRQRSSNCHLRSIAPQLMRTLQTVALFGLISLAPVALLMVTGFVRINVVLILLRQALGSPQVPGNQVLTALSLLLTALVMQPIGEKGLSRRGRAVLV